MPTVEDNTEINPDTGGYWDCPDCWWEGPKAPLNIERWEMECPECGAVLSDDVAQLLEEHADWERKAE